MYVVDATGESDNDDSFDPTTDIMSTEIVKRKVYTFPALRSAKGKEKKNSEGKVEYTFEISKEYQIFDYQLKDNAIRFLDGHKIILLRK